MSPGLHACTPLSNRPLVPARSGAQPGSGEMDARSYYRDRLERAAALPADEQASALCCWGCSRLQLGACWALPAPDLHSLSRVGRARTGGRPQSSSLATPGAAAGPGRARLPAPPAAAGRSRSLLSGGVLDPHQARPAPRADARAGRAGGSAPGAHCGGAGAPACLAWLACLRHLLLLWAQAWRLPRLRSAAVRLLAPALRRWPARWTNTRCSSPRS